MTSRHILVVHTMPYVRELIELELQRCGFEVNASADFAGSARQLLRLPCQSWPAAVVLEVSSAYPPSLALLHRLRTTPDLRACGLIPVLALVTSEGDRVLARASLNVVEAFELPFNLTDLVTTVERTVSVAPFPPLPLPSQASDGVFGPATELLVREQPAIVIRWAQRIAAAGLYPESQTRPSQRLGRAPILFNVLLACWMPNGLHVQSLMRPGSELRRAVSQHVRDRIRIGAGPCDCVRELLLLQDEIWSCFQQNLSHLPVPEIHLLRDSSGRVFDRLLCLLLEIYEEQTVRRAA